METTGALRGLFPKTDLYIEGRKRSVDQPGPRHQRNNGRKNQDVVDLLDF